MSVLQTCQSIERTELICCMEGFVETWENKGNKENVKKTLKNKRDYGIISLVFKGVFIL